MKTKPSFVIAALVAASVVLAGCGSGAAEGGTNPEGTVGQSGSKGVRAAASTGQQQVQATE